MKILWIALVWPEPGSSAAGFRLMQLIDACISQNHQVRLCSPCQINQHHQCLVEQGLVTAAKLMSEVHGVGLQGIKLEDEKYKKTIDFRKDEI